MSLRKECLTRESCDRQVLALKLDGAYETQIRPSSRLVVVSCVVVPASRFVDCIIT